jgi:6-phosphogluconolactonase/glucosamine-6-phosphate isomerase/deaminase
VPNAAREVIFIVNGSAKANSARGVERTAGPAAEGCMQPSGEVRWFIDAEAAALGD